MKKTLNTHMSIMILGAIAISLYSCSSSVSSESTNSNADAGSSYSEPVNDELATKGKALYNTKCISCHQLDSRVVGPPLRGVTKKRTHNWMMKMLENPVEWVKTDASAKQIFDEYNKIPMVVPGGTTEEERNAIVDYLRKEG